MRLEVPHSAANTRVVRNPGHFHDGSTPGRLDGNIIRIYRESRGSADERNPTAFTLAGAPAKAGIPKPLAAGRGGGGGRPATPIR